MSIEIIDEGISEAEVLDLINPIKISFQSNKISTDSTYSVDAMTTFAVKNFSAHIPSDVSSIDGIYVRGWHNNATPSATQSFNFSASCDGVGDVRGSNTNSDFSNTEDFSSYAQNALFDFEITSYFNSPQPGDSLGLYLRNVDADTVYIQEIYVLCSR